jgi:hypothetical protein
VADRTALASHHECPMLMLIVIRPPDSITESRICSTQPPVEDNTHPRRSSSRSATGLSLVVHEVRICRLQASSPSTSSPSSICPHSILAGASFVLLSCTQCKTTVPRLEFLQLFFLQMTISLRDSPCPNLPSLPSSLYRAQQINSFCAPERKDK